MIIHAVDPSLTCTGYAVINDDGSENGILIDAGTHIPHKGTLAERALELGADIFDGFRSLRADVCVVELPFAKTRGGPKATRSAMLLPNYGIAVGMALSAAGRWVADSASVSGLMTSRRVVAVPADEWSRGVPGTMRDPLKTKRVAMAAYLYNRPVSDFGTKSNAGNVADAVLLARWAMLRNRLEAAAA